MKKLITISLTVLVIMAGFLVFAATIPKPTTSWQTFEQQFPTAVQNSGLVTISLDTADNDQIPLPLTLRFRRLLWPEPKPQVMFVFGFPELAQKYLLESTRSHVRLQCLVRYTGGKVACIVVGYSAEAKPEAIRLRESLRRTFHGDNVSAHEIKEF